jgi:hypothetical protein
VLALSIALLLQASPTDTGREAAGFYSYLNGERWSFVVTREALRDAPTWDPAVTDAPPLPPGQALGVAKERLPEWLADGAQWRLSRILLHPADDGWVYVVEFAPPRQGLHSSFGVVVLMDGTIVSPQRAPWPPESRGRPTKR